MHRRLCWIILDDERYVVLVASPRLLTAPFSADVIFQDKSLRQPHLTVPLHRNDLLDDQGIELLTATPQQQARGPLQPHQLNQENVFLCTSSFSELKT